MKAPWLPLAIVAGWLVAAPDVGAQVKPEAKEEARAPANVEGFSIALVAGELRRPPEASSGGSAQAPQLPAVAAKALADMRDFLPYQRYRLLDAQWTRGMNQATIRLSGAEQQEYEVELQAQPAAERDIRVMFQLKPSPVYGLAVQNVQQRKLLEAQLQRQQAAVEETRRRLGEASTGVAALQAEVAELRSALDRVKGESGYASIVRTRRPVAPLIDTTFKMTPGETVVVGTSRQRGDQAIIVLLTAVETSPR